MRIFATFPTVPECIQLLKRSQAAIADKCTIIWWGGVIWSLHSQNNNKVGPKCCKNPKNIYKQTASFVEGDDNPTAETSRSQLGYFNKEKW